jgi:hypothetical protein
VVEQQFEHLDSLIFADESFAQSRADRPVERRPANGWCSVKLYASLDPEPQDFKGSDVAGTILERDIAVLIRHIKIRSRLNEKLKHLQ